jgi:hypothetical protein
VARPKETYVQARQRLLAHLAVAGWAVKPLLKVPNARLDGETLFFHPQAVHLNAHSLHVDIRGMSETEFDRNVQETIQIRKGGPNGS